MDIPITKNITVRQDTNNRGGNYIFIYRETKLLYIYLEWLIPYSISNFGQNWTNNIENKIKVLPLIADNM